MNLLSASMTSQTGFVLPLYSVPRVMGKPDNACRIFGIFQVLGSRAVTGFTAPCFEFITWILRENLGVFRMRPMR